MPRQKSLRLYHKHRLDYIRTGSPRSFRLMTNHWDPEFFTRIPTPVGKRHRDATITYWHPFSVREKAGLVKPEAWWLARQDHVHNAHTNQCIKNRYGPRCN